MNGLLTVTTANSVVGNNTALPVEYSPKIKEYIREVTKGKVVVQGSTTYIYHGVIADNDCVNVVLTSLTEKLPEGYDLILAGNPLLVLKQIYDKYPDKDIIFLGGMTIYEQFLSYIHDFYIVRVDANVQGNIAFSGKFFQFINMGSTKISEQIIPEIPTYPKTTMTHYRRCIH